jgi:hypothetical protein
MQCSAVRIDPTCIMSDSLHDNFKIFLDSEEPVPYLYAIQVSTLRGMTATLGTFPIFCKQCLGNGDIENWALPKMPRRYR